MITEPRPFPDDPLVIRISGTPTPEEWRHTIRWFRRSMGSLKRKIAILYLCCVVGAGMVYCWHNDLRIVCYVFPVMFGLLMLWSRLRSRIVLRESLEKRARIQGEDHWTFSPALVRRQAGPNHATFEWRYIEFALMADDMLVLMPTFHSCYCIPLRLFVDVAQMKTVAGWAVTAGVPVSDFRKGKP